MVSNDKFTVVANFHNELGKLCFGIAKFTVVARFYNENAILNCKSEIETLVFIIRLSPRTLH